MTNRHYLCFYLIALIVLPFLACNNNKRNEGEPGTERTISSGLVFFEGYWGLSAERLKKLHPDVVVVPGETGERQVLVLKKPGFPVQGYRPASITFVLEKQRVYELFLSFDLSADAALDPSEMLRALKQSLGEPSTENQTDRFVKYRWQKNGILVRMKNHLQDSPKLQERELTLTVTNRAAQQLAR